MEGCVQEQPAKRPPPAANASPRQRVRGLTRRRNNISTTHFSKPTSAPSTCRSVRGLTLRLADRELTPPAQGRQAIAIALPLLLEKGANLGEH